MDTSLKLPAPAKLNLRLHITGVRPDGKHLLAGEMILIDYADTVRLKVRTDGKIRRRWRHPAIRAEQDLALRAATLLQKRADCPLGVDIAIEKKLPIGGGLGGGSSNAATVLLALNRLWKTGWSKADLTALAAELGADLPFFLFGGAARIGGIGEPLAPLTPPPRHYLLVFPPVQSDTQKVFAAFRQLTNGRKTATIHPLEKSDNHLTRPATMLYPAIIDAARQLRRVAPEARMSGSGSTLFAEWETAAAATQARQRLPADLPALVTAVLPCHPLRDDLIGE